MQHARRTALVMLISLLTAASLLSAADWHVSPNGTAEGDGSAKKPWSLKKAFSQPEGVKGGDTIWLHGGTYVGRFISNLKGEPNAPIVVRAAKGERPIIDGLSTNDQEARMSCMLFINGGYTWYWGFEFTSSYPKRYIAGDNALGSAELASSISLGNNGPVPGIKLINLVVHDTDMGPGIWHNATDTEMYGCIIYNNGHESDKRGHGHATYQQNGQTERLIVDNIMFNQHSHGIHVYGQGALLNDFRIRGNILFNNGAASPKFGYSRNLLVGGGKVAEDPVIEENISYFNPVEPNTPAGGSACELNYGKGSKDAGVTHNVFVAPGRTAMSVKSEELKTMVKNLFIGPVHGFDPNSYADNTYAEQGGEGLHVFLRPNHYDPSRTHICVFNWTKDDQVKVDVDKALKKGDKYVVYDVQNYFGKPVASGTYRGKPILLPTALTEVAPMVGEGAGVLKIPHTPKEFNAYVMIRQ
jgi:hypothetical protein